MWPAALLAVGYATTVPPRAAVASARSVASMSLLDDLVSKLPAPLGEMLSEPVDVDSLPPRGAEPRCYA